MFKSLLFSCLFFVMPLSIAETDKTDVAIFAGGCFWCLQVDFDKVDGVIKTVVGYTGGHIPHPSYEQVTTGSTGHVEALAVYFDPRKVSYDALLEVFWQNVDPTDAGGQFCDRGSTYVSRIFYSSDIQKQLALKSKTALEQSKRFKEVVTQVVPASQFYPAEDYHQAYYKKNPLRYKFYRYSCGRDATLKRLWGQH